METVFDRILARAQIATNRSEVARNDAEMARAIAQLTNDLGQRYTLDRVRLERFEVYHAAQQSVVERIRRISKEIKEFVANGRGIILHGTVGTGKDHLLAYLLWRAAWSGVSARFLYAQDLYRILRDGMSSGAAEGETLRRWKDPSVLVISDPIPPARAPTEWQIESLYALVNARYHALKSTWISVNARTARDAEASLTSQVVDRLRHDAEVIPCFWPSYRERDEAAKLRGSA